MTSPTTPSQSAPAPLPVPAPPPPVITVNRYGVNFTTEIQIAVSEDQNLPIKMPAVKVLADAKTPFKFSLEDAIQAADRHLYIRDKKGRTHDNPDWLVEDWVNLLKWEVSTFWMVDPTNNWYGETADPEITVTSEHPRRAGEMLAEGITVLFAERRLKISRAKIFFYDRKKAKKGNARPDFAVTHNGQPQLGITLVARNLFGLESRSRKLTGKNIPKSHHAKLKRKRGVRFAGVLAVYCSYGKPTKSATPCRIILADPEDVAEPADDVVMDDMLLTHYIKVLSRLGMWDRKSLFEDLQVKLRTGKPRRRKPPLPDPAQDDRRTIPRSYGNQEYRGRIFNSLLAAVARGQLTRSEALSRFDRGAVGRFVFRGLNTTAIALIDRADLRGLEKYFDELAVEGHPDATIGADGTIVWTIKPDRLDLIGTRAELDKPSTPGMDAIEFDVLADDSEQEAK